jgi:hypothetical protein
MVQSKLFNLNLARMAGMLCASGVDGGFSGDAATENAKARFLDDWDEEE